VTRRLALVAGAVITTALGLAAVTGPAAATTVPVSTGATALSVPAYVGTGSASPTLALTGALGGVVGGIVTPIINSDIDPLVAALQGTLSATVGSALGLSSSYVAGTPAQQTTPAPGAFPGDLPGGLPAPCSTTSATQPCYNGTTAGLSLAPLVSLGVGALRGYTQQVSASADSTNPIFGRAQAASATVSVLPAVSSLTNPLVSTGAVDSKSNCPTSGTPTASVSAANVSLLGGAVTLSVANGSISTIKVGSTSYSLTSLPTTAVAGFTLSAYGSALELAVPLTLSQLVTGLGLGTSVTTELLGDALPNASLTLRIVIGPNTQVTSTSASAWGLGIGVDLSGSLGFSLAGVIGATVTVPSAIGGGNYGNLLDARLAYTACQSGTSSTSSSPAVVPPMLI
jgi:hypothetical protein